MAKLNRDLDTANLAVNNCRNEKAELVRDKEKAEADANELREDLRICQARKVEPVSPP